MPCKSSKEKEAKEAREAREGGEGGDTRTIGLIWPTSPVITGSVGEEARRAGVNVTSLLSAGRSAEWETPLYIKDIPGH